MDYRCRLGLLGQLGNSSTVLGSSHPEETVGPSYLGRQDIFFFLPAVLLFCFYFISFLLLPRGSVWGNTRA